MFLNKPFHTIFIFRNFNKNTVKLLPVTETESKRCSPQNKTRSAWHV